MQKAPFFSICMPVFQGEAFIGKAIDSVCNQTFSDWELIIVDNASTDRTWEIIQHKAAADFRIKIFRNKVNLGMSGNWNESLRHASGQWIGSLAADDVYLPEALQKIAAVVKESEIVLWMHAHYAVHSAARKDLVSPFPVEKRFQTRELAELLYLKGNIFGEISCYFVSKAALEETNSWVGKDRCVADQDLWMRIALSNPRKMAFYSPEVLTETSIHEASDSARYIKQGRNWFDIYELVSEMSDKRWSLSVQLRQLLRITYCLLRYGRSFTPESRSAAKKSLISVVKNLHGFLR